MAWLAMHTLWTRQSFRAGSWKDAGLQEAADARPTARFCPEVGALGAAHTTAGARGNTGRTTGPPLCPQPHSLLRRASPPALLQLSPKPLGSGGWDGAPGPPALWPGLTACSAPPAGVCQGGRGSERAQEEPPGGSVALPILPTRPLGIVGKGGAGVLSWGHEGPEEEMTVRIS